MKLKRAYDLDVVPGGMPQIFRVSKGNSVTEITFSLYAGNGALSIPSAAKPYIRGKLMNDEVLCGHSYRLNQPYRVIVDLTKEMTAKTGRWPFEIVIRAKENDKEYTLITATFIFDIR